LYRRGASRGDAVDGLWRAALYCAHPTEAYRGRGRRGGGRSVADGRGDGRGQHTHVHHHLLQLLRPHRRRRPSTINARWPRSARAFVRPRERASDSDRARYLLASATSGRPSDVTMFQTRRAVTHRGKWLPPMRRRDRVHTKPSYRVVLSADSTERRRRRRKESAPASGPDASKSGRARKRYR